MIRSEIYLPGLNGIRAIAAIAVIFSHIGLALHLYDMKSFGEYALADYGVTFFFGLSGFLITYLLIKEKDKLKDIDVKKFYIRRLLRIWPLYYFVLVITILILGLRSNEISWMYFAMMPNVAYISGMKMKLLGHYWSVGVEEQFYLFWPWFVKKFRKPFLIISLFAILFFLLKVIFNFYAPQSFLMSFLHKTRFDCLALGGIAASLLLKRNHLFLLICKSKISEIISWVTICLIAIGKYHIFSVLNHEVATLAILVIIINQVDNPKKIISLENKVFDYLGKISYGLYIYNPIIIYLVSPVLKNYLSSNKYFNLIAIYVVTIFFVIVVSHLSYFYFEKQFLKLKDRFSVIKSKSSAS